ncbi:FecR family protein [Telluribacter sp.]|jgi:ferric-dicitrate binding protein FerR (iron transport regulator)|uniref:FecR family protein n=1 Tax=Telluribacter sp. TaxID=1978767 RepID=UPI002E15D0C2|nr:FecR domain-containing protein [Telluribacter sp.]
MRDELYVRKLLSRYLSNECTEAEIKELFAYLGTREGEQLLQEAIDREARNKELSDAPIESGISGRMYDRLLGSIEKMDEETTVPATPFYYSKGFWQMAAALIGILMVVGIGFYSVNRNSKQVFSTEAGQKRTLILPDGSRVILNSGSTLVYDTKWHENKTRTVELEGEAFFVVSHDSDRPFFVKTARAEIKVLGTAFNVKSFKQTNSFETTLIRGKVTIRDLDSPESQETVLTPNEKATLGTGLSKIQTSRIEPETSGYWQKGRLVFEDESIQNITVELEKWFGVKIIIDEESKNCRFHLNVDKETLPEVLRLFETITGARAEINGKTVVFTGKLCEENFH